MNEKPWTLYRVVLKVRPAAQHPLFWQWQFGYLQVWLHAPDPQGADDRARTIAETLSYETLEDSAVHLDDPYPPTHPYLTAEKMAKETGLALQLVACPTGTEEINFPHAEPP